MAHQGPQDQYRQPYPQQPPQPYGQQYAPQQPATPPTLHDPYRPTHLPEPKRSPGLSITAMALGVVAVVLALTPLRGVAVIVGLIAAVLATVALVAKSLGGKKFAAAGLALGLVSLPVALLMYMWAVDSTQSNVDRQQELQKCIEANPENVLECANQN